MKVKDLIQKLQALPEDLEVMLPVGYDFDGFRRIETITTEEVFSISWKYFKYYPEEGKEPSIKVILLDC